MSFEPVYNEHSRALILGTWPSPKSREMAFYYGHPQNRFWPVLAALTGEPVPAREDIEAKKQIILRHGLALWDTLERCTITGAADASIKDAVPNDIAGKGTHRSSILQRSHRIPDLYKVSAAGVRHCSGKAAQHQPGKRCLPPGKAARNLGRGSLAVDQQMMARL